MSQTQRCLRADPASVGEAVDSRCYGPGCLDLLIVFRIIRLCAAQYAISLRIRNEDATKFSYRVDLPGIQKPVGPGCMLPEGGSELSW